MGFKLPGIVGLSSNFLQWNETLYQYMSAMIFWISYLIVLWWPMNNIFDRGGSTRSLKKYMPFFSSRLVQVGAYFNTGSTGDKQTGKRDIYWFRIWWYEHWRIHQRPAAAKSKVEEFLV